MISKKNYGLSTVLQNLVFIGSITSVQTFFVGGLANETVINIVVEVVTPLTEETKVLAPAETVHIFTIKLTTFERNFNSLVGKIIRSISELQEAEDHIDLAYLTGKPYLFIVSQVYSSRTNNIHYNIEAIADIVSSDNFEEEEDQTC